MPQAVAAHFGDQVYPGENILDKVGNRVGSTRTLFTATNAGGRTAFALESVDLLAAELFSDARRTNC
jgi:carbonic anhydrase